MPRKISEKEKKEIIADFLNGDSIDDLSKKFKFSKITISRHIKKNIDEGKYKDINKKNNKKTKGNGSDFIQKSFSDKHADDEKKEETLFSENLTSDGSFVEIAPLDYEIDNMPQKDLSSIPISEVDFPKVVYMIVDKNIELVIKLLRDYPEWQFLSQEELKRKTIEIFLDLKNAKRSCNKEQKVIKVPNTEVFKIVAPILVSRGISRIISADKLIAL